MENGIVPHTDGITHAKHAELVHANKHILKLHETIRAECTLLAESCVSQLSSPLAPFT